MVYARLKSAQLNAAVHRMAGESPEEQRSRWAAVHDGVGRDLYQICASLGGAYVKVGQFFSTRPDLVPEQWCRPLGMLCDAAEPMDGAAARAIVEEELRGTGSGQALSHWCNEPLGSASVAQVHSAVLAPVASTASTASQWQLPWRRSRRRPVAIKVRRPEAEMFFARDFAACGYAAALLQRFELSLDLLSCVEELRDRVDDV